MWCLVVFQHDLHGQCLPQGKEKLLLKDSLSKRQSRLCTLPLEYYDVITKQMNFNFPCHCNQWKHQAKRQWLGAKCGCSHIFYNISAWNLLKCNETNFNSSFGNHELLSFICFSLRGELGNGKKVLSLLWKISLPSGSIYEHKNVDGGWNKGRQIDDEARLSLA